MPQFNEGNINSYLVPSGSLTGSLSNSGTLTGQIAIGSGGGTTDYNDLTNKPQINSVTLSGNKTTADLNISYNDLDDKPVIPAAQVNSDWNAESGVAEILNKPTIPAAQVNSDWNADSGVAQILNKPTIPAAQVNSDWNADSGVAEILNKPTIPTALDDLSDVSITSTPFMQYTWLGYNLNHNKWEDIVYQPYLNNLLNVSIDSTLADGQTIVYEDISNRWINANYDYTKLKNKPTLATVATSGSYNDLSDQPTIPDITTTNISSEYTFTKDSGVWEIHSASIYKTGNTYQALFTLKGDGTAVAAGSDGCVYSMSTGTAPLLFSFFIAMVGTSFCLGFYNSGDSTWHFRPINAAVTLNANSRLNFSGVFIK